VRLTLCVQFGRSIECHQHIPTVRGGPQIGHFSVDDSAGSGPLCSIDAVSQVSTLCTQSLGPPHLLLCHLHARLVRRECLPTICTGRAGELLSCEKRYTAYTGDTCSTHAHNTHRPSHFWGPPHLLLCHLHARLVRRECLPTICTGRAGELLSCENPFSSAHSLNWGCFKVIIRCLPGSSRRGAHQAIHCLYG
jgi:hypothetical protein